MSDQDEPKSVSIAVLDLHLDYLRRDVGKLVEAVAQMATREDFKRLEGRMEEFATKHELKALEEKVSRNSVPSTVERWATMIQKVGAAAAVLGGASILIAHFLDRVK